MRGSIRQRVEGSWEIKFDLPPGQDGKRRQRTKTIRGSRQDAERELARIYSKISAGTHRDERKKKSPLVDEASVNRADALYLCLCSDAEQRLQLLVVLISAG